MPLPKLNITIPQEGYAFQEPEHVLRAKLGTGPSRMRLDMLGAPIEVDVTMVLDPGQYQYWRAFYRASILLGSLPFLADLLIDTPELQERECRIIPGTHQLTGVRGDAHMVSMRLEVKVPVEALEAEAAIAMLYGFYGEGSLDLLNRLAQLVNSDLPEALG